MSDIFYTSSETASVYTYLGIQYDGKAYYAIDSDGTTSLLDTGGLGNHASLGGGTGSGFEAAGGKVTRESIVHLKLERWWMQF